jgi:hypothetical protein
MFVKVDRITAAQNYQVFAEAKGSIPPRRQLLGLK